MTWHANVCACVHVPSECQCVGVSAALQERGQLVGAARASWRSSRIISSSLQEVRPALLLLRQLSTL